MEAEGTAVESWTSEALVDLPTWLQAHIHEGERPQLVTQSSRSLSESNSGTVEVTNVGEKDSKGENKEVATNSSTMA